MSLKLWISTGSSRKSLKWTPELIDWEALCERLLTVTRTAETQAEWDAMSPDQRSAVKDVGGYVGGRLEGERRKADAVKARQLDEGTKRRLAVAVFPHTPKPSEIIVDLMDQLVAKEGGAILQWMIDGAVMYWKQGCVLRVPESVKAHTKQYIDSNDWMNQFLADCCEVGEGKYCKGGELYGRYRAWCAETGERYPRRNRDFANELLSRGFERRRGVKGSEWSGLEVLSEFMD